MIASPPSADRAAEWLAALRQPALALNGYAVIMQAPDGWREQLAIWGYKPDALDLMKKLKASWDPAGILNPHGFVVG